LDDIRLHGRPDLRPMANTHAAELALVQGNLKRALPLFAEATAANAAIGTAANVVADSASVTRMEIATLGESPRGVQRMDALLAKTPLKNMSLEDRPYFSVARTYARLGHPERARAILAELERDVHDTVFKRTRQPALLEVMGEIALAENKPAEAIVQFRRADVLPDGPATACPICLPVNLARAFDAAHQSDSAIAMYEKFLTTPYVERLDASLFVQFVDPIDPIFLAGVRRRLGELYEAKGDTGKAVEQYRAFIEQWKNADPELQARVAEVRRRLQALTPVEKVKRSH
jgi:tetratricopeptide (TPR) repeat protein